VKPETAIVGGIVATHAGVIPATLVIAGGSSRIPHLREALAERFGITVEPLNPFNRVQVGKGMSPDLIEELGSSVSIAVGLAARRAGDTR